ncbi:hypothetical protein ACFX2I_041930 [Malus domestica]
MVAEIRSFDEDMTATVANKLPFIVLLVKLFGMSDHATFFIKLFPTVKADEFGEILMDKAIVFGQIIFAGKHKTTSAALHHLQG